MEECEVLSNEENRTKLEERRTILAEKQRILLETKSKINRGKLSDVNNVTDKTLNVFLRSCCDETEKEQTYVNDVIERVRETADHTFLNLQKVNQHAENLLRRMDGEVSELRDNLEKSQSGHIRLSAVIEKRLAIGKLLKEREESVTAGCEGQLDRAEKVFDRILSNSDKQVAMRDSRITDYVMMVSRSNEELSSLDKETDVERVSLTKLVEESEVMNDQLQTANDDLERLETQLASRSKAKECAESDQARIEMEVCQMRQEVDNLTERIDNASKSIGESDERRSQMCVEIEELIVSVAASEAEVSGLEKSYSERMNAEKENANSKIRMLEKEVEDIVSQNAEYAIRADVMDKVFGTDVERTPEQWRSMIEDVIAIKSANKEMEEAKKVVMDELSSVKPELEKRRLDAKNAQLENDSAKLRIRNMKNQIAEERKIRKTNTKMADARMIAAVKEMEFLKNDSHLDKAMDSFVTPNPRSSYSVLTRRKTAVESSRGLNGDSDDEHVTKDAVVLPEGISKRFPSSQQIVSSSTATSHQMDLDHGRDGSFTESTAAAADEDGDVTVEGLPIRESIDRIVCDNKVDDWMNGGKMEESTDGEDASTTAEMMDDRNDYLNSPHSTDMTQDMGEETDFLTTPAAPDQSDMQAAQPPVTTAKTLSPQPVRESSIKSSILANDSDSDLNVSQWDDDDL